MGCLGAFFCGDFSEIGEVLGHRLHTSGKTSCLTVIVFANQNSKIFQDHIAPYIGDWHYRSAEAVEFVFPGYQGLGDPKDHDFKAEMFENAYQNEVFVRASEEFERRSGWRYSGEPSLIICNSRITGSSGNSPAAADLQLSACVVFDLAKALRENLIDSVPALFQGIIRFAKDNPGATSWDYSDRIGVRSALVQFKDGLINSLAKWLKLEDLSKPLRVAECFAIRNLEVKN